jgi:hypothetical protein
MQGDAQTLSATSDNGKFITQTIANRPQMTINPNDSWLSTGKAIEGNPEEVVAMMTGSYGECKPVTLTKTETELRTCDKYREVDCVDGADLVKVSGDGVTFSYPNINVSQPWVGGSGCSLYYKYLYLDIEDVTKVNDFVLNSISWDDSVRITINGTEVYVNGSFGRCERGTVFGTTLNQNLKQYLINGRNTIEMLVGVAGMGFGSSDFSINYDVNRKCSFIDNCKNIPSNCSFKSSQCLDTSKKDDSCVYTQNLYSCATTTTTSTAQVDCGSNIYCLNGQCEKSEENSDNDFVKPISYLTALNQAGKDNDGAHDLKIFTGGAKSCEKDSVSYNNCCKDSGWGQDYAGASCSTEEQELAQMQSKKLCHYVGSYCSKKVPLVGGCLKTKKSSCCFNSKIARIIIEQGRSQLGMGWGSAQSPDCRGFTPDEMSRLKFDKMDLSEIASDIANSVVVPDSATLQNRVKESMKKYETK